MRIFGGDRIKALMNTLKVPEDQPIEASMISKAIESAQGKVEGFNFDAGKYVLEYDDIMNKHREVFYKKRNDILERTEKGNLREKILEMVKKSGISGEDYENKEKEIGSEKMRQLEKIICLKVLDTLWIEHLENMAQLRDSVKLRAYGQRDPLVEYKTEGHRMFQQLLSAIEATIVNNILGVKPQFPSPKPLERPIEKKFIPREGKKKVGRNDPCPCGKINPETGKPMKYKRCCWPKYG